MCSEIKKQYSNNEIKFKNIKGFCTNYGVVRVDAETCYHRAFLSPAHTMRFSSFVGRRDDENRMV